MIFASLSHSLVHLRSGGSVDVGQRCDDAGRDAADGARTVVGRPRKRERSALRSSRSTSPAPSAGHRPRRAGRVKGGAVRGPRTPHSTVATRCPPGTRDPTTTTSRAASTRKPGRSRVRAMSVRYDPAFHGQPRSLPATLASRSAPVPRLTGRIPKLRTPREGPPLIAANRRTRCGRRPGRTRAGPLAPHGTVAPQAPTAPLDPTHTTPMPASITEGARIGRSHKHARGSK